VSRYFARLVQRASGTEPQTSAAPSPAAMPSIDPRDPFERTLPLEPTPASSHPAPSPHFESVAASPQRESTDSAEYLAPAPPEPPPLRQVFSRAKPEDPAESELASPQPAASTLIPPAPSPIRELPKIAEQRETIEHTVIQHEVLRELIEAAPAIFPPPLSPAFPKREMLGRSEQPAALPAPSLPPSAVISSTLRPWCLSPHPRQNPGS
jgi:hypothetical protein